MFSITFAASAVLISGARYTVVTSPYTRHSISVVFASIPNTIFFRSLQGMLIIIRVDSLRGVPDKKPFSQTIHSIDYRRDKFDINSCLTLNNMTLKFKVELIQEPDGGYIANVPALPGCHTQGDSFDEVIENVKDAIQLNMDVLSEESTISHTNTHSQIVEVSI